MSLERDIEYMLIALEQAKAAMQQGEVPVGAVLVHGDDIVACAHNMTETLDDPTAHAELIAIQLVPPYLQQLVKLLIVLYACDVFFHFLLDISCII